MIRNGILTIGTFVSVILFPWPLSALLAVGASFFEPLVPLAVGLFADALYFVPHVGAWPVYSAWGLILTATALFVRGRLSTSIIER
ncbi:MAG: hypothetical protein NUV60_03675 [Patescibacteria group bacterium]|nr:hypothetical protein [Patescibacteria group bacterium]